MHRRLLMTITLMTVAFISYGQQLCDTVLVCFPKENAIFNATYKGNGEKMDAFFSRTRAMAAIADSSSYEVQAIGTASPEGQYLFNQIVADRRQKSVTRYLKKHYDLPATAIKSSSIAEDWDFLVELIRNDPNITHKDRILDVIKQAGANEAFDDATIEQFLKIGWSRPYWYMYHNIFPKLRSCRVIFRFSMENIIDEVMLDEEDEPDSLFIRDIDFSDMPADTLPTFSPVRKKGHRIKKERNETTPLTLKANAIGYTLGVANIAVETGITECLSFALPFYYSGLNYFKSTLKFRVCTLQPELRYNFRKAKGLYAGIHLGVGWFNYALDGPYRIQDTGGKRPAWGGGLGVGYRMPLGKSPRWGLEFALGAGVYDSKYDMLYNEENGPYYRTGIRKTWIGIDNASVAVTYRFDMNKGRNRR